MLDKLRLYISENLQFERNSASNNTLKDLFFGSSMEEFATFEEEAVLSKRVEAPVRYKSASINEFIDNNKTENKFQRLLFEHIDKRELKDSDVYNKVHIDRRLFSKIRSDSDYHPSKETVILLGLSLELNEDEIIDLLESASYSLPKNNHYDLIIRFCFIEGIYKINEVNNFLSEYGCKEFSY